MEFHAELETILPSPAIAAIGRSIVGYIHGDKHTHDNHPFKDGTCVTTSRVKEIFIEDDDIFIVTMNTVYKYRKHINTEIRQIGKG